MQQKLLFFDVDGTLYNTDKQLPASAKQAITQAKQNGHIVAIATGRGPFMIDHIRQELDVQTFVSYNGQYVVHQDEVIFTDGLTKDELSAMVAFAEKRHEPVVFMTATEMIASVPEHAHIGQSLATLKYDYPRVDATYFEHSPVYQLLLYVTAAEEAVYEEAFPHVQLVRWHPYSCDVLPKEGSKARGIQKLATALGFSMEDVIAFGDGLNDVQMLQAAGVGVCMGNGHPEAKRVADIVVGHVDEDGLAKAMEQLQLI